MPVSKLWLPLRNHNFGKLWIGQVLSQVGTRMYQIAIAWWLVSQNGESAGFRLSLLFIVSSLPAIFLSTKIGKLVDQTNTRNLILISEAFAGIVCFSLVLTQSYPLLLQVMIYVVGFLLAFSQALVDPALFKSASEIVDQADVELATGLVTSTTTVASLVGAFMGAFVIAKLGLAGSVLLNGASYILSAIFVSTIPKLRTKTILNSENTESKENAQSQKLEEVSGFKQIRLILIAFGIMNFFSIPTLVVMPLYVLRVLSGTANHLALVEAALAGGMLLGSILSAKIPDSISTFRVVSICVLLFALSLGVPALFQSLTVYLLSLASAGLSLGLLNVKILSYFQSVIPDNLKGQFFAKLNALTSFAFPAAFLLFGILSSYLRLETIIFIQSISIAIISFWFFGLTAQTKDSMEQKQWT